MTCIVGIRHKGGVTIGGDSCFSSGSQTRTLAGSKVFRCGEAVLGVAGDLRDLLVLRYRFSPPPRSGDLDEYMNTAFVDAMKESLREAGRLRKDSDVEDQNSSVMVGIRGRIYLIDENLCAARESGAFTAIGSGEEIALGALFVACRDMDPEEAAATALSAAAKYEAFVARPFSILTLPK